MNEKVSETVDGHLERWLCFAAEPSTGDPNNISYNRLCIFSKNKSQSLTVWLALTQLRITRLSRSVIVVFTIQ
jgi:hypothetical protein